MRSNKRTEKHRDRHALIIENRWPVVQIDATRAERFPMDRETSLPKAFVHICSAFKMPIVSIGVDSSHLAIIEGIFVPNKFTAFKRRVCSSCYSQIQMSQLLFCRLSYS
jgi:hypothetical protein